MLLAGDIQADKEMTLEEARGIWFGGTPKAATWDPPPVYSPHPSLPEPDIWALGASGLVFPPTVAERLGSLLYRSGELLPLPFRGETWEVLNITLLTDCMDPDATEWQIINGTRHRPHKPAFYEHRLPDTLFKIPELRMTDMCVEGRFDREEEFKASVEDLGLKGLRFIPVWDPQDPGFGQPTY